MAKISVTRALAQLKTLNDRIQRASAEEFVTRIAGGKHSSGEELTKITARIEANYQSVTDMLAQRAKLKAAVVLSNATTSVEVGGVIMTVAEAIERKGSIGLERNLLRHLATQISRETTSVNHEQRLLDAKVETLLGQAVGKDRKVDAAELQAIRDAVEGNAKPELLDPLKIQEKIEALNKAIEDFTLDVDFALSEVNARTLIEA